VPAADLAARIFFHGVRCRLHCARQQAPSHAAYARRPACFRVRARGASRAILNAALAQRLKPANFYRLNRGAKAPLFHVTARVRDGFRVTTRVGDGFRVTPRVRDVSESFHSPRSRRFRISSLLAFETFPNLFTPRVRDVSESVRTEDDSRHSISGRQIGSPPREW
jgi:hypothetical protein